MLEINALEPLPYQKPEPKELRAIEVIDEDELGTGESGTDPSDTEDEKARNRPSDDEDKGPSEDGQITLF